VTAGGRTLGLATVAMPPPLAVLTPDQTHFACTANAINAVFYKDLPAFYVATQHNRRMLIETEG
jgi:hypothetical protein